MRRGNIVQRFARTLLFAVYTLVLALSTAVVAQTTIDLEPPQIQHTVPTKIAPGSPLNLSATITDDGGIEEATVFYRSKQTGPFKSLPMTNTDGANYTASIPVNKKQQGVRYYIEVMDQGGNRVIEGSPSSPLVVQAPKRSNLLYVALGVVAVGLLAGAAGGGSSNGGTDDGRLITIDATVPE